LNGTTRTLKKLACYFRAAAALAAALLLCAGCLGALPQKAGLTASLDGANRTLEMGRGFDLTLTITNTGEREASAAEIRLPAAFLKAFRYLGSLPVVTLEPLADGSGVLRTRLVIPPSDSERFILRFETVFSGIYEDEIAVLAGDKLLRLPARLEVKGSIPAGWAPGAAAPRGQNPAAPGLPEAAVVRVGALVNIAGRLVRAWSASGVIISSDGLILTSARAVLGSRFYPVSDLIVGLQTAPYTLPVDAYLASIVQVDEALDAALIKPRANLSGIPIPPGSLSLPALPLAQNSSLIPGEEIRLLGYGQDADKPLATLIANIIGLNPEDGSPTLLFISTNLPTAGDYFGWAALNSRGELIGLAGAPTARTGLVCGALADTNRDEVVDDYDHCLPAGGSLGTLTALPALEGMLGAGWSGEVGLRRVNAAGAPFSTEGKVVYAEDFSAYAPAWKSAARPGAQSRQENGALVFAVSKPRTLLFSTVDYAYDRLLISTDARLTASSGDGDFGFVCAFQDDNHFIALEVSEDGYFSIWKRAGLETTFLVDWTYSDLLSAGPNLRLSAQCGADGLKMAVNDRLLGEAVDKDYSVGLVGLMAGTYEGGRIEVIFEHVEILIPGVE